ncbi:PREDICTED: uncharacterized protein LOC107189232 [Dufourea novaeangliae]|uniref:Osiris 2 n=1 Tax=Dufourea novaeangliae TaxID=178035 RepID=A0A154PH10_DUFNO|nr:PREDICTED: uncharacterized protein LOC107189232 [Dufourea novaeangliae]KZC11145.1 hypothetical protein WN55_02506 [Dufourea novaeangliae]
MRLVPLLVTHGLVLFWMLLLPCQSVTFEDEASSDQSESRDNNVPEPQQQVPYNGTRQGKGIFDWIGLGTGRNVDPYIARTNKGCLNGDLADCFKSQALSYFSDFFDHSHYDLNDHVKVVRMSRDVVQDVSRQPYEYSSEARSSDSEWDHLMKFALRKVEKFVKTAVIELHIPSTETGENDVYAPRFLDEIADEIDTLENKKDTLFSRHQLKKLLIPMLIVLKLFKLKLLLFLPLILGLASFKKFLGFLAIVIPGLIGFFKLYKPLSQNYQPPVYSQSGVGYPYYKDNSNSYPYGDQNGHHGPEYQDYHNRDTVSFGQDLAYRGYREYQS